MSEQEPRFNPEANDHESEPERVEGGVRSESGTSIIEAPPRDLLEKVQENEKIGYFPAQIPQDEEAAEHFPIPDTELQELITRRQLGNIYDITVTGPLGEYVQHEFKDSMPIAVRGTVCSLDGDIDLGDLRIKDIRRTVTEGTEKEGDKTLVAVQRTDSRGLHHRTAQWLPQSAQELRAMLKDSPELQSKIYPVLLVYDLKKLKPGKALYEAILPLTPEERKSAILKAIVLDYPKTYDELQ